MRSTRTGLSRGESGEGRERSLRCESNSGSSTAPRLHAPFLVAGRRGAWAVLRPSTISAAEPIALLSTRHRTSHPLTSQNAFLHIDGLQATGCVPPSFQPHSSLTTRPCRLSFHPVSRLSAAAARCGHIQQPQRAESSHVWSADGSVVQSAAAAGRDREEASADVRQHVDAGRQEAASTEAGAAQRQQVTQTHSRRR